MTRRPGGGSFADEHRAVRDLAGQVLHLLEPLAVPGGAPEDRIRLREHLEGFRRRLSSHFSSEELVWQGRPERRMDRTTSSWIERLVREHRGFERRLADVLARLDSPTETSASPSAGVADEIRGILAELLEHELSESRLFQRTVFEEAADLPGDSHGGWPSR